MKLSKRLRKWKANLTTQTPVEYVLTLRADVNGFADEVKALEAENAKLRKKPKKPARKIALPLDRCGTPIHVGDWLWFEEGDEMVHVTSLTYEGDGMWCAGDEREECACDNLSGGVVVGEVRCIRS